MGYIANEIETAAERGGIYIEEVIPARLQFIRDRIEHLFMELPGSAPLWERIKGGVSVRNQDAWRWISSVPLSGRAIVFFEEQEEPAGFAFSSGADVVRVLAESIGFEFYVTDDAVSFLLAFNHHDCLSAAGDAVEWLQGLM